MKRKKKVKRLKTPRHHQLINNKLLVFQDVKIRLIKNKSFQQKSINCNHFFLSLSKTKSVIQFLFQESISYFTKFQK